MLGALPVPDSISEYKKFSKAYKKRISDGHPVVIYPEAHVWPYYTGIRPFEKTSFRFPAELKAPVYVMTTTYTRRRFFGVVTKRPKLTVYVDGPYYTDSELSIKENQQQLRGIKGSFEQNVLPGLNTSLDSFGQLSGKLSGVLSGVDPLVDQTKGILDNLNTSLNDSKTALESTGNALQKVQEN